MLHVSTQTLIQKLHELTLRGSLDWKEAEAGGVRLVSEGYLVELTDQPSSVRLLQTDGRVLEEVSEDMLASATDENGRDFAQIVAEMAYEADRHAKGTEKAISAILGAVGAFEITGGRRSTDIPQSDATVPPAAPDPLTATEEEDAPLSTEAMTSDTPEDEQSADPTDEAPLLAQQAYPEEIVLPYPDDDSTESDLVETLDVPSDAEIEQPFAPSADADAPDTDIPATNASDEDEDGNQDDVDAFSYASGDSWSDPAPVTTDTDEDDAATTSTTSADAPEETAYSMSQYPAQPFSQPTIIPVTTPSAPHSPEPRDENALGSDAGSDSEEAMAAAVGAMVAEINSDSDVSDFDDDEEPDAHSDSHLPVTAPDISAEESSLSKVSASSLAPTSHGSSSVIRDHGVFGSLSGGDTPSARVDISDRGPGASSAADIPEASLSSRLNTDQPTVANDHHSWERPIGATTAYNTATAAAYLPLQDDNAPEDDNSDASADETEESADSAFLSSDIEQVDTDAAPDTDIQAPPQPRPPAPPAFIAPVTEPSEAVPYISAAPAAPTQAAAPTEPPAPSTASPIISFHGKITSAGLAVSHALGVMIEGVPEDVEARAQSMMKTVFKNTKNATASDKKTSGYKSWF